MKGLETRKAPIHHHGHQDLPERNDRGDPHLGTQDLLPQDLPRPDVRLPDPLSETEE